MKNNQESLEQLLKQECDIEIKESGTVKQSVEEAYDIIRKSDTMIKPNHKIRILRRAAIAVAAILLLAVFVGVSNPALAANIPIIGKIFSLLESKVSYPGDYSEYAVELEPIETTETQAATENAVANQQYTVQDGQLTVSLSEVSYDSNAIYVSVQMENEEGFPDTLWGGDYWYIRPELVVTKEDGTTTAFNEEQGNMSADHIEGQCVDNHKFVGILMLNVPEVAAYKSCRLSITQFSAELTTGVEKPIEVDGETINYFENDIVAYDGDWSFEIPIDSEMASTEQTIMVQETNAEGFGIEKIVYNRQEIYAEPILPEGKSIVDYMVTIWDADGKPLESHGNSVERYSVYGRDISTITVHLLTYEDWADNKAENYRGQTEKALFQKEIVIEE